MSLAFGVKQQTSSQRLWSSLLGGFLCIRHTALHLMLMWYKKRYLALKTWQSVKRRLCFVFEAINVTEDFKRKTQDWQSQDEWEADRQHVFFPSRGIFCGQAWLLEMKDRLRGCGIVKSLNPFTKAPSYNILLHSISLHLWCALDFPLFSFWGWMKFRFSDDMQKAEGKYGNILWHSVSKLLVLRNNIVT